MIAVTLRKGQADKLCYSRLSRLFLSLSYQGMVNMQVELGSQFLKPVDMMIEKCNQDMDSFVSLLQGTHMMEAIPVINDDLSNLEISHGNFSPQLLTENSIALL